MILTFDPYRIFITHGHRYNVYSDRDILKQNARLQGCDIAMYGHTHVPEIDLEDDVWVLNPGSIALPRQPGRQPSYMIMEIDASGKAQFTMHYYER